jgi:hypothetical protein
VYVCVYVCMCLILDAHVLDKCIQIVELCVRMYVCMCMTSDAHVMDKNIEIEKMYICT